MCAVKGTHALFATSSQKVYLPVMVQTRELFVLKQSELSALFCLQI